MTTSLTPRVLFLLGAILSAAFCTYAQNMRPEEVRQDSPPRTVLPDQQQPRPNLLEELGLSPEQVRAIRRINMERKPVEQSARKRFQEAQRALNLAIYNDAVDENDIQAKLSEFQAAQAELARIKFTNELAVRKLLTPAQLVRFRELRRDFAEARKAMRDEPPPSRRPLRGLRRRNMPVN